MRKVDVTKGMLVTCKHPVWAYYQENIQFTPGMIGVVGAVDVPYVRTHNGRDKSFVCVDFYTGEHRGNPRFPESPLRCALDYDNIKAVKDVVVGYSNWLDTLCIHCVEKMKKVRGEDFENLIACSQELMLSGAIKDQGYRCDYCGNMFPEVNFYQFRQRE